MVGVQASGAAPMAEAFFKRRGRLEPWDSPETVASAIRIGNPVSWRKALKAVRESKGFFLTVTDDEILGAQKELAEREGLFVEPASAAPMAAMKKLARKIERGAKVVCIATGNGLKDPSVVDVGVGKMPLASDIEELKKLLQHDLGKRSDPGRTSVSSVDFGRSASGRTPGLDSETVDVPMVPGNQRGQDALLGEVYPVHPPLRQVLDQAPLVPDLFDPADLLRPPF